VLDFLTIANYCVQKSALLSTKNFVIE